MGTLVDFPGGGGRYVVVHDVTEDGRTTTFDEFEPAAAGDVEAIAYARQVAHRFAVQAARVVLVRGVKVVHRFRLLERGCGQPRALYVSAPVTMWADGS